ncbi:MAG: amidohydrolase [Synergistaceae bacterium]|nr:amidohydrolase [Synergistaceae bacterium]
MQTELKNLVAKHLEKIMDLRCRIHKNPELSNEEAATAELVAATLKETGMKVITGVSGHGVVGVLQGAGEGPCIALRADMDALPMEEKTGHPCESRVKGVMHACGHDVHTATLLGAALVLSEVKDRFNGTVKFVFQPAEEFNPTGGAPGMIDGGVLQNPDVDGIVGLHVWPSLPTGTVATKDGALMGASDRLFLTVKGRGAHGSEPDNGVDAIAIASQIISALQTIVSRNVSPLDAAVVTIGTIKGGDRYNVIAEEVVLEGTVRTVNPETQEKMPGRIETLAGGIARGMGGDCEMKYIRGYPPLMNDPGLTKKVLSTLAGIVGEENVIKVEKPALGGEDFAFFTRKVPGCFLWLGCRPEGVAKEDMAPLHNNRFLPDEKSVPLGVEVMVRCALDFLGA